MECIETVMAQGLVKIMGPPRAPLVLQDTYPDSGGERSFPGLLNLILAFLKDNQRGVLSSSANNAKRWWTPVPHQKPCWVPAVGPTCWRDVLWLSSYYTPWRTRAMPSSTCSILLFEIIFQTSIFWPQRSQAGFHNLPWALPAYPPVGGPSCSFPTPWWGGSPEVNLAFAVVHCVIPWPASQASLGAGLSWQWEEKMWGFCLHPCPRLCKGQG